MKKILIAMLALTSVPVWSADKVQQLNVRTGLWETTATRTTAGEMPIPAGMLARLSPEQRARLEARMKANSASKTKTTTHKSCLTKEKLAEAFADDARACHPTIVSSTTSKAEIKFQCDQEGMKLNGNIEVVAADDKTVTGTAHVVGSGSGHTMNTTENFSSKWLGPNCGDVD